jgi:S-adenosylmethionine synthetase
LEVIERKGKGHPDTIADRLAEELGNKLKKYYLAEYGCIKHYNVDKVLVSCGKVDYDKREMVEPVKIVFSGNATELFGLDDLLLEVVEKVLHLEIKRGLEYKIFNHIALTSPDLTKNFKLKKCNDTSFAVAHPLTEKEELVLNISKTLQDFGECLWGVGTDHKVMYIDGEVYVAVAIIANDKENYDEIIKDVKFRLKYMYDLKININTGDTDTTRFNTLTGTSLEQGDAGMTGRGNRRNGLITPCKAMTMEAYCGKNDITHIGRTYQDKAQEIADKEQKEVLLVNHIGGKVDKPKVIFI